MIDGLVSGLEQHFMTAVLLSGALALLIAAAVALLWYRGRRWVRPPSGMRWPDIGHYSTLRMDDSRSRRGDEPPNTGSSGSGETPSARLVREAATRAAALREAWDRSYREARKAAAGATSSEEADRGLQVLIEELLVEQRQTNALLRDLVSRLERPRD
jgi:hypothetical protein